ncbi:MAG: alkaline shock response membrane anchor protein AmaP [Candidatus Omnitrophota bacterium]
MKVANFFAQVFAIFAFLTVGSLLVIVSLHILSASDAVSSVQELYTEPWSSLKTGILGLVFITVGLVFSKMLLKTGRSTDAILIPSEGGPVAIQVHAIEDLIRKVLKRFQLVKDCKMKVLARGRDLELRLRFTMWAGGHIPELLMEIQDAISARIHKLMGAETKLTIQCDVIKIEDHHNMGGTADSRQEDSAVLSQ